MKKLCLALAFGAFALTGMAQEATPTQQYSVATNSFWSNWFVEVGGNWNAWYSGQEHGNDLPASPFKKFRSNPGASIAVGKWFTPGIGLRTKLAGIWGKTVYADAKGNAQGSLNRYWGLNEQVMFNLSNLIFGYNENRVWNLIPFAGAGMGRTMTHNLYAMNYSLGIQSTWKICKNFKVYAEAGWDRFEGDIDGMEGTNGQRGWTSHDNRLYAEVGLHFDLGKATWNKVPDVDALNAQYQSQLDALKSQLDDANAENDRLKNLLANQKPAEPTQSIKEFITTPVSVFFDLGKAVVANPKDIVNVRALAKYAKDNNSKMLVEGYCDSATGTKEINDKLSKKRADVVADKLVEMGVNRDNITTKAHGGVSELSPISFNRRATVQVVE